MVGDEAGYAYFSFDDASVLSAARQDPVGFADRLPPHAVMDEIQHAPELFSSLKRLIDRDRKSGRFILTGSANVLLVPRLSDSLAGRMEILRLFPLAQCEIKESAPTFIDEIFSGTLKLPHSGREGDGLAERILQGGYPEPLARTTWRRRREWYRNYVETIVQRDIRDLAKLSRMDAIPRLLELAAGQTARLLNVSELSAPFQLSRPTIRDYLGLIENIFLIDFLPSWHSNRMKRLVKTPKLHIADTGLAGALLGLDPAVLLKDRSLLGQLLESFVYGELRRQASWHESNLAFYHYRDKDQYEVDVVIQQDGRKIAGIEVKASGTVTERDFRGLNRLRQAAGNMFAAGIVLYDGEHLLPFGGHMHAVPISALWG